MMLAFGIAAGLAVVGFAIMAVSLAIFGNRAPAPQSQVVATPVATTTPAPALAAPIVTATPAQVVTVNNRSGWKDKAVKYGKVALRTLAGFLLLGAIVYIFLWLSSDTKHIDRALSWWEGFDLGMFWPSRPIWLLICIVLIGLFFLVKNSWRWVAAFILIALIVISAGNVVDSILLRLDRGINHGDWSAPADYVPRVNGGTLRVPAGHSQTADISGRVRIPIPVDHCLDISPKGAFNISWDSAISNAFIEPRAGGTKRGTITALHASGC